MMIWDDIIDTAQKLCSDSSDDTKTFLELMGNEGYIVILTELGLSNTEKTETFSTVASRQFYQFPVYYHRLSSITITTGGKTYPITVIEDNNYWNKLNVDTGTSNIPAYAFLRKGYGIAGCEIGFYPKPTDDDDTFTAVFESIAKPLSASKVQDGSVAATNGSEVVAGTSTSFTSAMVDRYFRVDDDAFWYRIVAVNSATSIDLENVFNGTTATGASYTIAEAPHLPHEAHILLSYFMAAHYFGGPRKNSIREDKYWNLFYTGDPANKSRKHSDRAIGGLVGLKHRYSSDTSGQVFKSPRYRRPVRNPNFFPTTISEA